MGLLNLVRVVTTTTGTGPVHLGQNVQGFLTMAQAGAVNGGTYSYAIEADFVEVADDLGNTGLVATSREDGTGIWNSGTGFFSRIVSNSTNSNALLSLHGDAQFFITPNKDDFGGGTPSLPFGSVQINNAGSFGGDGAFAVPSIGTVTLGRGATATRGIFEFIAEDGTNVTIQPLPATANWTLSLPTSPGTSGYLLATDGSGTTHWQAPSAAGAAAPVNAVQFNLLGALGGDADFTWVTGSGLTSKRHAAFGNIGGIDDQGGLGGTTIPAVISIAQQVTKDLSGLQADGLACYSQWKHTGASPTSYIVGGDFESIIDATNVGPFLINIGASIVAQNDGTGTIQKMYGVYGNLYNFGNAEITSEAAGLYYNLLSTDGHIVNARVMQLYWENDGATPFDAASTVYVFRPFGLATNSYGIYIEDQSGIGSAESLNIKSLVGGNLFTGHVAIGNFAAVDQIYVFRGAFAESHPSTLTVNDQFSGDLSPPPDGIASVSVFPNFKHTGINPALVYGLDCEPNVPADSTGPFGEFTGFRFLGSNFGSGQVDFLAGANIIGWNDGTGPCPLTIGLAAQVWSLNGTAVLGDVKAISVEGVVLAAGATAANVYGLSISDFLPGGGGTATNVYGVHVKDLTGLGSVESLNIKSVGANSLNVFEGELDLGMAGHTGLLKLVETGGNKVTVKAQSGTGNWTLSIPTSAGTAGYLLTTNGVGVTSWQPPPAGAYPHGVILADTTYYVRSTGDDTTGDGSLGTPWLTIQHAMIFLDNYDFNGHIVFIDVGAGSFGGWGYRTYWGSGFLAVVGAGSGLTTITAGPNDGSFNFGETISMNAGGSNGVTFALAGMTLGGAGYAHIALFTKWAFFQLWWGATVDLVFDLNGGQFFAVWMIGQAPSIMSAINQTIEFKGSNGNLLNGFILQNQSSFIPVSFSTFLFTGTPNFGDCFIYCDSGSVFDCAAEQIQLSGAFTGLLYKLNGVGCEISANSSTGWSYNGTGVGGTTVSLSPTDTLSYFDKISLSRGAMLTAAPLATGNITVDCSNSPIQYITNNGAYTITAPASDGTCLLLITNGGTAGATTFSGFSVGASTGDALDTTNGHKFTISIWRINGTSGYRVAAMQ